MRLKNATVIKKETLKTENWLYVYLEKSQKGQKKKKKKKAQL
jgi:hypothetical protein